MIPMVMLIAASCHPVEGDRITAADLAAVLPAFAVIAPETVAGYAPVPGAHRNFEPAELTRFAAANGLEYHGLATICFEPALIELDPTRIETSIRESLNAAAIAGASVEILEYSKFGVPSGTLSFPIDSLPSYSSANTAIWHGFVEHENRHYPVWARVRITAPQTRIVAAADLRAGQRIESGDVRLEEVKSFPSRTAGLNSAAQCEGMSARRYLKVGTPVTAADLIEPNDVDRGETVIVEVQSGGAVLNIEAQAEASGRRGQSIALRNATSGKIFHAKITGKGRALLDMPLIRN
jgi:flagella basal body P-ring formation protein FlgA